MDPTVASIRVAMIIIRVPISDSNSMDLQLAHANVVPDPRHYGGWGKFSFSVHGTTLTITRTDYDEGWPSAFRLRAYLSTEDIPDFTSTVYTYWGLDHERAPDDTTEVIIHPSVTTIKNSTFYDCRSLVRVAIPDTVTHIEQAAFMGCDSLKSIRLSLNLEFIGRQAFGGCESVETVFLPPTVTRVRAWAFQDCKSLRFCNLPDTIDHVGPIAHLRRKVFQGCNRLSRTVSSNLSKVCYSTSVDPQAIQECIDTHGSELATEVDNQQMTALHILCANPYITGDCIRTYLQLAPEAANQEDSDGMTPFQRLCRNDIAFSDDRNFSSLMIWWYHCMPPQTATGKKRKRE